MVSFFISPSAVASLWLIAASEGSGITSAVVRPIAVAADYPEESASNKEHQLKSASDSRT